MEVELITLSDRSTAHITQMLEEELFPGRRGVGGNSPEQLSVRKNILRVAYNRLAGSWCGLTPYDPAMKKYWDPEFVVTSTLIYGYYVPANVGKELPVIVWEGIKLCVNRLPGMVILGPVTSGDDAIWYLGDGTVRVPMDQKDIMHGALLCQLGLASEYPREVLV